MRNIVRAAGVLAGLAFSVVLSGEAQAVPAFAEQTGQPCAMCHVGGFGPQLTPFGREFKLDGYTMRAGSAFTVPVSAMAVASFVHTQKDQSSPPAPHYAVNDNTTIDQVNLFLAGGDGHHLGGFAQFTYDGVGRSFSWDNMDLRVSDRETFMGSDVVYGLSVNNNPTVQDEWNTLPAWGFPYTGSSLAPGPSAGPIIAGAISMTTIGVTAYAWWDSHIYTEAGAYFTPSHGFLRALGSDAQGAAGVIDGGAPYFRVAYQRDMGNSNFEVGAFGLFTNLEPPGTSGPLTDDYSDYGVDASYQYMGDSSSIYQVNARYTHEDQNLNSTFGASGSEKLNDSLEDLRLDLSYYWHNTIGATIQPFDTWGSRDTILYGGDRTFTPNSTGVLFQVDYTLFPNSDGPLGQRFNARVGAQYTVFTEFNGAASNFDGAGSNAGDNNTLRVFLWAVY
jgi:hypothetical protein